MCPPLVSSDLQFECNSDGVSVNCSIPMKNGTRAVPKCKPTHQLPNGIELTPTVLICLSDGKWDGQLFKCVPCNYCILLILIKCIKLFTPFLFH